MHFPLDLILMKAVVACGLALAFLGLFFIRRGRFPRRRGTTPHCAACDYDLTGLAAPRCPECGAGLTDTAVVRGERHRRPRLALAGAALLFAGLALAVLPLVPAARSINWYQYKPTNWVIDDLRSPSPQTAQAAWDELQSRDTRTSNPLTPAHHARLADVALWSVSNNGAAPAAKLHAYLIDRFDRLPADKQDQFVRLLAQRTRGKDSTAATDALAALNRLIANNRLTAAHHAVLTEVALAEQAAPTATFTVRNGLMDYLGDRAVAGALTPAQEKQFYDGLCTVALEVRPTVIAGDDLPYAVRTAGTGPDSGWWRRTAGGKIALDGKKIRDGAGSSSSSSSFGGGSMGSSVKIKAPGKHTLEITHTIQIYTGKDLDPKQSTLRHERTVTLAAHFEVLPSAPAGDFTWTDDPSLAAPMRKAVTFNDVHFPAWNPDQFEMIVQVTRPPADAAFDVFARTGEREHRLGSVVVRKGEGGGYHLSPRDFKPAGLSKIDVLLRASESAARRTTWCYGAWKGELVFENVPVTPRKEN